MRLLGLEIGSLTEEAVARLRAAAPNYGHVRSTLRGGPDPAAPRPHDEIGQIDGRHGFDAAKQALRSWQPQRAIGAKVVGPPGVRPDLGETVVLGLGAGRARLLVPTRIVAVVDEPDRYGYAYGTLPGHPFRGEELFLVERTPDAIRITIRVQALPSGALRFLAPLTRRLQRRALRRYRATLQHAVRAAGVGE